MKFFGLFEQPRR